MKRFVYGVVAQFFYIAAQVGVGAFFINYVTSQGNEITSKQGAFLLTIAMFNLMFGRFLTTWLLRYFKVSRLLTYYAMAAFLLCGIVILGLGGVSIVALLGIFFFMSMMFPTIFSTAIKDVGSHTKRCSSILMMAVVGGAISPYVMGYIADHVAIEIAYVVPLICFAFVFMYGRFISK
jgi:FHS family L-fucose permease-like MFS transporter